MGLKTKNYVAKKLGMTLPEAYAIVKDLTVKGTSGYAIIAVQTSRENADKVIKGELNALEEVRVDFIVNRDDNDRATAYVAAKSQKTNKRWNPETKQMEDVTVNMPFYGWKDDIQ